MVAFSFLETNHALVFLDTDGRFGTNGGPRHAGLRPLTGRARTLSSVRPDEYIFLSGVLDAEEKQAERIESLLRKIHGMESVKVAPETAVIQRMIALFRILCDMTDRAEVLHLITSLNARAVMVRPRWLAFEVVGTPQEIEGIYQSALAYGIVDVVSSSCLDDIRE